MEQPVGGYFGLELRKGQHFHKNAIRLNSARNCLAVILRSRKWKKIYLPYYTCEVVLQTIISQGLEYGFYHIDSSFNPIDLPTLDKDEAFLYTNYWGIKQEIVEELAEQFSEQLIVDNAQAFFAPRIPYVDTFYSPRKFLGVPDGGYLYTDIEVSSLYDKDHLSWSRMTHLCRRIDEGPENGFSDYHRAEESLASSPILMMSELTESLLSSIDYQAILEKRRNNFSLYHTYLSHRNSLELKVNGEDVPMCYPFLSKASLREKLLKHRIFIPYYWRNVKEWCSDGLEGGISDNLLALPLDQRYGPADVERVVSIIND